jgi:hypothetical protein
VLTYKSRAPAQTAIRTADGEDRESVNMERPAACSQLSRVTL